MPVSKPERENSRQSLYWKLLLGWAVLLLLLVPLLIDSRLLCLDVAMYLECGERILLGQRPYVDFVDINPPLIMYLSVLPNLVAKMLSVHVAPVFTVLVILLLLGSLVSTWQMLRRPEAQVSADEASALVLALLVASLMTWLFKPQYLSFGQREHLFVILGLPFVVMRFLRHREAEVSARTACFLGVAAGIGVALKVHFLLVLLAPEAVWCVESLRNGRRSKALGSFLHPEWAALATVGVCYLAHFLFLPAVVRDAFFGRWLPMVLSGYSVYHVSWDRLIESASVFLVLGLCIPVALLLKQRKGVAALALPAAAFATAGFALYFGQHKYWPYHLIPAWTGLCLCCSALLLTWAGRNESWQRLLPGVAAVVLVGLSIGMWFNLSWSGPREGTLSVPELVAEIERVTADGDQVAVLSDTPWPAYPALVRAERRMGTRFLFQFPLMMLNRHLGVPAASPFEPHPPLDYGTTPHSAQEAQVLEELREDLARIQPRLILIPDWCVACPAGFEWWTYFQARGLSFEGYADIGHQHGSRWLVRR